MFFTTGSFPFGDHEVFQKPRRNVDTTSLYETLGVAKNATSSEIKLKYRALVKAHHPDKRGDAEVFKKISHAYEILSDSEKRKVYDEYGEEGLEGGGRAAEPPDLFEYFLGGGRSRGSQGKRKGEDIEHPIKVTMEQIYNGATRKMAISKDVICSVCDGFGAPQELLETCTVCNGTGIRSRLRCINQIMQSVQQQCNCRKGKVLPAGKECKKCSGVGIFKERKVLEVFIEKGVPHGHRITFSGEADQRQDTIPGDVRFIVDLQEHPVFRRKGNHLFMTQKIFLYEALTEYRFLVQHLDGRKLVIQSDPNEIIQHGAVKAVKFEGMPIHKDPFEKGHLFIEFHIIMPKHSEKKLQGAQLAEALKRILPVPPPLKIKEDDPDIEIHTTIDLDPDEAQQQRHHRSEVYEEETEETGHPRVECRQQ